MAWKCWSKISKNILICFLLNHIQLVCTTAMLLGETAIEKGMNTLNINIVTSDEKDSDG